jgi:hypothetical protein
MKTRATKFTVEVPITSLSLDMNLVFNEYFLMWLGGRLPREPGLFLFREILVGKFYRSHLVEVLS